ncbi:MAG: hypothetical protein JWM33_294 [Caulobacteraceae bacterium]|nr:hypothetical protein [Caulobacteraceae bacterium]
MALDLDSILAPVSDDNPVGEDLAYDNGRQQLEQAFEVNEGEEGEEKDWRPVFKLIEEQVGRTKDLWLPVYLARAGAKSGSLAMVELGAQGLAGLMERYWDTVHPQLEELGLPGRKSPCDSLASRGDFLIPLEKTVLIAHPRLGAFTGQDIERFRADQEAADGYGMFRATLEEIGDAGLLEVLSRIEAIDVALRQADKIFTDAAAGDPSPNYANTYATLATIRQAVSSFLTTGTPDDAGEEAGNEATSSAGGGGGAKLSGKVQNRDDVIRALDAIADYYRRAEPGHPIQQLTQRARHWVNLDFMALMKEIAPDGVRDAERILNRQDEDS